LNREVIDRLLDLAKTVAPEIEAAVAEVKDPHLRTAIAAAIMQRILQGIPEARTEKSTSFAQGAGDVKNEASASGTQGRIVGLRAEDFFSEPRRLEQVLEELRVKGYHHNKSDVRMSLLRLARKKLLRRIPFGSGRQRTFLYVNP